MPKNPMWSPDELAMLEHLQSTGLTYAEMAPILRRSASAIQHQVCRRDIRHSEAAFRAIRLAARAKRPRRGVRRTATGYVYRLAPEHPRSGRSKYVAEHRLVVESTLGRLLRPSEEVHHVNRVKDDNRPENLEVLSRVEHQHRHHSGAVRSQQTRQRISAARRAWSARVGPAGHSAYKWVSKDDIQELVGSGRTVKAICEKLRISNKTFYNKLDELGLREWYCKARGQATTDRQGCLRSQT